METIDHAEMLIVVPPFAGIDRPSLGVHTLQSVAANNGVTIRVLYANIILASVIGEIEYETISFMPTFELFGERIIGSIIHRDAQEPPLDAINIRAAEIFAEADRPFAPMTFRFIRRAIAEMVTTVIGFIESSGTRTVGFSTTFEQTNATALLARAIRSKFPEITLIAGGANCEDEMATAMCTLIPELDYVFSGEVKTSFGNS